MIYIPKDTDKVSSLFEGWEETMIRSCLQKVMGQILVTDLQEPRSACARLGSFCFLAGEPDAELAQEKPRNFSILVPGHEGWDDVIERAHPNAVRYKRFALRKDTHFDRDHLERAVAMLPKGYEIKAIDEDLYDRCLRTSIATDFVYEFEDKERFLELGRGYVILRDGEIVSGASSYSRYKEGIEIEVDTLKSERRKNLAFTACARLILACLDEGLYPSWDAQNLASVHLAEKLGYEFSHEYTAYAVVEGEG